ncbi:glutathione synthetase [Saccharospirillum sp. MSK14-1]|uniref:glutathione synthase n=1 Tax=Saccharospirillum sp. MSK14-1 TaxID=1897632 RepID=UPI000D3D08D0|nr:glutathione synthase [Saccharospirillum sp. MSK14-1]PTY39046.1 glutathione synthetase [Saccharospirillum sp. MSK14-1]
MYIAFLINAWEDIEPGKSSTLVMIQECLMRQHKVALLYPQNLTVRNNVVHGFSRIIQPMQKVPESVSSLYKRVQFDEKMLPLHAFDCIMVRKDPPIEPTLLSFLDAVKNETLVINDVDGLRKASNKLYNTTFHDPSNDFLPETHVSKNKDYLKRVIRESKQDRMILKPLDGSGGHGVIVLEKSAQSSINSLLDFYIDRERNNYVILQEYIEGAENGDVRVLMLNGKAIGAYHRKPAEGDVRANIQAGGSAHPWKLTEGQKRVCRKIGPKLVADGLDFVGLDLIGERLLEVNVCNPGGITNINRLSKTKLQRQVIDFLEDRVNERQEKHAELEHLMKRLSDLRSRDLLDNDPTDG